jgi:hypothetical protein
LTPLRERFARLLALSDRTQGECYLAAGYSAGNNPDTTQKNASALANDSDIILRVAELRRPVIRALQKEYSYTLQDALRECEELYDLSKAKGNEGGMARAIELKSKLVKILSDSVDITHRHVLDGVSSQLLLEMKQQLEDRKAKRLSKQQDAIDCTPIPIGDPPGPPNGSSEVVPYKGV